MPTILHQLLVRFFFAALDSFVTERKLGFVLFAPLPVKLTSKHYREPDVVFVKQQQISGRKYPLRAELVMEVVSPDAESHERDYQEKREAYAQAEIPEYWIIDPQQELVTVLVIDGKQYRVHGEFRAGQRATSALLPEFGVDVAELFAAGKVAE